MKQIEIDDALVSAIIRSTEAGLQMADVSPTPVGYSKIPARSQDISVVIGLVGRRNGTVRLNLSTRAVLFLANKFMDSDLVDVNDEVLDAVGEITNIIAGRLKAELGEDEYGITNISCPSIIVGADYHVYHFRGFASAAVEFELDGIPAILLRDRLFSTIVSLSRS